jgi:hypothetical protein
MNFIKGTIFKINNVEYEVIRVTFKSITKGIKESYEFRTRNWDKPVEYFEMNAKDFESKAVKFENFVL